MPLQDRDKADAGCLVMMLIGFGTIFFGVAFFFLGGAPFIIPVIVLFLLALVTPFINPTEKMGDRRKWTGRLVTFLVMALILAAASYYLFVGGTDILRE